jgi:putative spermidine/putrescine transport system substrate-binding protein
MRRGTTVAALFAAAAIVVGCSSGASGPEGPAAAASPVKLSGDACAPPRQEGVTLTLAAQGGEYQEAIKRAWEDPYTALTGVEFVNDENSSNATVRAQVESGQVTWDVVDTGSDFGLDAHKALLEPLDYGLIPRDEMNPDLRPTDYRVPVMTYGTVLAVNTDETGGRMPAGWADFFDTSAFPGKRGVWDYPAGGIFETALMADGVAPAELYPLDLERATAKLDAIKDDVVFWDSGAESRELIGSGEVAMSMMWNGRTWNAIHQDNRPVEIQWNQQILSADHFVVPKGSPNREAAMRFIAWVVCAENNPALSKYIPYGPTNVNSEPDPAMAQDLPVNHVDANTAYFDDAYLVDNLDEIDAAWQEWKSR